jgi:hypothetical protein
LIASVALTASSAKSAAVSGSPKIAKGPSCPNQLMLPFLRLRADLFGLQKEIVLGRH